MDLYCTVDGSLGAWSCCLVGLRVCAKAGSVVVQRQRTVIGQHHFNMALRILTSTTLTT